VVLILALSPACGQIMVMTSLDGGPGSLRQAIADAFSGDTITFDDTLSGQTIMLLSGQLLVDKDLIIDASDLPDGITIDGNYASRIFEITSAGFSELTGLTLIHGYTSGDGGAIYLNGSAELTIRNSTLSGNTASNGGGIASSGTVYMINATLSDNSAETSGGGIYNGGLLMLTNTIVAANTAASNTNIYGSFSGVNNLTNGAPLLAFLGDYGGPTQTMPPLPGSPAVDAGDNAVTNTLTTDQRGFARIVGSAVDIGAVEGVFNPDFALINPIQLGDGTFQFSFSNLNGASFTVLASTNVALPFNLWSDLGPAVETSPGSGQFYFIDPQATNHIQRYYRVNWP